MSVPTNLNIREVNYNGVNIPLVEPETQTKTVTPTTAGVTVTPDAGKLLSSVTVNGDADLVAGNIKSGVNIFGVDGTLQPAKTEQSKTLTLGAAAPVTVTPDSGKVLSSVPVSIDTSVIKAENIAKDVTMLGISGTHEGGGGGDDGYLRIGGRIFYDTYDDYGDNGATYQFFDTNKTEITYTGDIDDLEYAVYYKVTGVPKFDRFYVFDNTSHGSGDYAAVDGIVSNVVWGMYEVETQYGIWDNDSNFCNKIGSGKALSALALARCEKDSYGSYSDPTIWQYINHCNATRLNGCGDWFILSRGEHDALMGSSLVDWYDNLFLWSSVEDDGANAWFWDGFNQFWLNYYKNYGLSCFAARAF